MEEAANMSSAVLLCDKNNLSLDFMSLAAFTLEIERIQSQHSNT